MFKSSVEINLLSSAFFFFNQKTFILFREFFFSIINPEFHLLIKTKRQLKFARRARVISSVFRINTPQISLLLCTLNLSVLYVSILNGHPAVLLTTL